MATSEMIDAQRAYTRELLALGLGGVVAGLAASGLGLIAQGNGAPLSVLSFGAILGLGANLLDAQSGRSVLRLVLGVLGGVSMALLVGVHGLVAAAIGGLFLGAALSLEHGSSLLERGGVWLAYAMALVAAFFTADTLLDVGFLSALKDVPVVHDVLRAGIWSVFLMLPAGLKYVRFDSDEVQAEFRRARAGLDDRHLNTLRTAEDTYGRILEEIAREGQAEVRERSADIAREVAQGLIELTRRSNELHATLNRTQARPLEVRARELEARIRGTRDAALKKELVAALGELVEQMRTRRRLETACARIEARQQRYLTALDKLHVTLVQNDSLSQTAGALNHSLDELSRLTEEVHYKNLSVDDLVDSAFDDLEEVSDVEDDEIAALLDEVYELSGARASADTGLPRPTLPRRSEPPAAASPEPTEGEDEVVLSDGADGFVTTTSCEDGASASQQGEESTPSEQEDADVEQYEAVSASSHAR